MLFFLLLLAMLGWGFSFIPFFLVTLKICLGPADAVITDDLKEEPKHAMFTSSGDASGLAYVLLAVVVVIVIEN